MLKILVDGKDDNILVNSETFAYTVKVYTSPKTLWKHAGTDSNVYLTLQGTYCKTERKKLDKRFHNDLEAGFEESYGLIGPHVGEILYVVLEVEGWDDWHLDKIVVCDVNRQTTTFPFYDWVAANVKLRPGKAVLPFQETNEERKKLRHEEIETKHRDYVFSTDNLGLPGSIANKTHDDLPRFVQFHDAKANDFELNFVESMVKFKISTLFKVFDSWDTPDELSEVARRFTDGEDLEMLDMFVKRWDEDTEFGRQMLNGVNPAMIQRCTKIPDNIPVTDEIVKPFLKRGESLEDEMKSGHVYYVNYEDLVGVPRRGEGKDVHYCADPLLLLYVRPSGEMVPIAIKLDQSDGPIWTPDDGRGWTLAKIHVKCADLQMFEVGTHLMRTHLASEAFAIAMLRNFSSVHPVYKMLLPHIKFTIAVNTIARNSLIKDRGIVDQYFSIGKDLAPVLYRKRFQWSDLNLPQSLAKRGVYDRHLLPNYHYRDDAILLWGAIFDFMKRMVCIYYKSDDDVTSDAELQSFMKEMKDYGFPTEEGDLDKGCPDSVNDIDDLCNVLAMIIFNGSCQHAAVNFGQFQQMSFPTNYPLTLRQPPPKSKWDVTLEDIMAALPKKKLTAAAVVVSHSLSQVTDNEVYLGEYPDELFSEREAKQAQEKFRDRLKEISVAIHKRNEGCDVKYRYLLPERIPASVAV